MVSVVPSIIPILTANAVAANQPKKQKKPNGSGEKKLKDSPLNDKINCRVYLNNGKTIEGHFNGYWYEDNSDEEGIWIKTDNGILTINSDEYDRVQYYHKKPVKESSFNEEINSIFKNAGCSLVESQNYFTDWNSIKDKVVKMYIRSRLEETGMLEDDEWFIQQWIEDNASADMIEKIYDECGTTDIYWASAYINKNADAGGIITQVVKGMVGEYFDRISNDLQKEFEQNNLIYRMIDSDKSPKEIAQILKTNGTGNCWAKQEENAKAYYGKGNYNEYCLIGETTIDNVNWETTIFLRMMAEEENEVRLKKDSPIHIVGIKYYHYNEDNKLDKKDHMKVDMTLSVGHSYVFNESKQVNESIAFVSKKDLSDIILKNPTKRELRENNLTLCRCIEDSEGNWYFADMENMLHAYIVSELRDEASFPLFDGNDCYGIAYYDAESNEFWYNLNDYMYKKECIEQYNNSEYLRTTFPNARVIPNPWNNQMYDELYDDEDDDEELDESIIHAENCNYDNHMAVVLKNPTKRELRENGLDRSRFICFEDGTWLFFDSMQWIHAHIWDKYKDKFNGSNNMGFYDLSNNEFIFIESLDYDEDEEGYEEEVSYYENKCKKWLLTKPYIRETFGLNPNVTVYGDWVDSPW